MSNIGTILEHWGFLIQRIFYSPGSALCLITSLTLPLNAAGSPGGEVECIGSEDAKGKLIYLHGFEKPEAWSGEESSNRLILKALSEQRSLHIALPLSPFLCKKQQRCWASSSDEETLKTFEYIQKTASKCWPRQGEKPYTLLGFSNGGYFAFKLYKIHRDPKLMHIIGVGSAGTWDPVKDSVSQYSKFSLIVGRKELTLPSALKFERELKKSLKDFQIQMSPGGHKLDLPSLLGVLSQST